MREPKVPPTGYSGTPLAQKLGLKKGHRLVLFNAPTDWEVAGLPQDVACVRRKTPPAGSGAAKGAHVLVGFFADQAALRDQAIGLAKLIVPDGSLWVAWPRRASGHVSDITDNVLREVLLPLGLVDVKVAALDQDWSGLKFVWRKELRASLSSEVQLVAVRRRFGPRARARPD